MPALLDLRSNTTTTITTDLANTANPPDPSTARHGIASNPSALHFTPHQSHSDSYLNNGPALTMRSMSTKRPQLLQTLSDASDTSQETLHHAPRSLPRTRLEGGVAGPPRPSGEDSGWHMRHGWDSQYSAEQLRELSTVRSQPLSFVVSY